MKTPPPRIHVPGPLTAGSTVSLRDATFAHAVRALRMKPGDALTLFNGDGREYPARLERVDRHEAAATVLEAHQPARESPLRTELLQAVGKGERMDWAVQKAVELGVATVRPVITERCNVRLDAARWEKKAAHLRGVAVSACEQCGRVRIPEIHAPGPLDTALAEAADCALKLVLHASGGALPDPAELPASAALLIGPEGGLTDAELDVARTAGFRAWSLGPRVLRTETAPAAALAILQYLYGDASSPPSSSSSSSSSV